MIVSPLIGLLVVRYLGSEIYGQYASATAVTAFFGFLCDFGVQQTVLKFGSSQPRLGPVLKLGGLVSLIYTLIAVAVVLVWINLFEYDTLVRKLVLFQCAGFVRTPLLSLVTAGLQLQGQYGRIAFWNFLASATQWIATLLAMLAQWEVTALTAVPVAVSLLAAFAMVTVEGRRLGVFSEPGLHSDVRAFVGETCKFGTAGAMYQVYYRADAAILSATAPSVEVGYYSIGARLTELLNAIPGIMFNQVLFPKYFRWSKLDREKLLLYYRSLTKMMVVLGLNMGLFLGFLGPDLVRLVFGMDSPLFRAMLAGLGVGVFFHFWAASPGAVLTTDGYVTAKIRIQATTAGMSLLLNALLVPGYGSMAASLVFALSNFLLAVRYTCEVSKRVRSFSAIRSELLSMLAAYCVMAVTLQGVLVQQNLLVKGLFWSMATGCGLIMLWFRWFEPEERHELVRLASKRKTVR